MPNVLTFEFVRHGTKYVLASTTKEIRVIFGMPRTPRREYEDVRMMSKGGWCQSKFFKRNFPFVVKKAEKFTIPMIQKATLNLLTRTQVDVKNKEVAQEKQASENEEGTESEDDEAK